MSHTFPPENLTGSVELKILSTFQICKISKFGPFLTPFHLSTSAKRKARNICCTTHYFIYSTQATI